MCFEIYEQVSGVADFSDCILLPLLAVRIFLCLCVVYVHFENSSLMMKSSQHSKVDRKQIHFPYDTGHMQAW